MSSACASGVVDSGVSATGGGVVSTGGSTTAFSSVRGVSTLSSPAVIGKILKELFALWGELR